MTDKKTTIQECPTLQDCVDDLEMLKRQVNVIQNRYIPISTDQTDPRLAAYDDMLVRIIKIQKMIVEISDTLLNRRC